MRFAKLTVCFENNFTEAAQSKAAKYMELFHRCGIVVTRPNSSH